MREPWYLRRWPDPDGLSWLGKLNYYVLQWTGRRLAVNVGVGADGPVGWSWIKRKPREGWL